MRGLGKLTARGAAWQMAADEALLEGAPIGAAGIRFYDWAAPAVTFGYSQAYDFALRCARDRGMGDAQLVRRATGGGVVFHDGDLTFSLVFPWDRLCSPALVYKNIHRGVHLGLKAIGVKTFLKAGPAEPMGAGALEKACFVAEPEPMDLLNEKGEKVLGGALRRRGQRGLYQGSLRPERLAGRPREELERAIATGLEGEFPALSARFPPTLERLAQKLEAKYTSDRWNRRR